MKLFLLVSVFLSIFCSLQALDIPFEKLDSRNGFSSDIIEDFCQDQQGFVWVATTDAINKCIEDKVEVYRPGISSSTVYKTLCLSPDNILWIGTENNGVICFNPLTKECRHITPDTKDLKISHLTVNGIIADTKGRIWIATPMGLNLYDPEQDTIKVFHPSEVLCVSNSYVTSVYEDNRGRIFASTWGQAFFYYKESEEKFYPLQLSDNENAQRVWCFHEDSKGIIWVGTWGGGLYKTRFYGNDNLVVLDQKDIESSRFKKESLYNIVYDINEDVNGWIWLATDAGVGVIRHPEKEGINIEWLTMGQGEKGAVPKDITVLFNDEANSIWMGTNVHGVFRFDLENVPFHTYQTNVEASEFGANAFSSFWEMNGKLYAGVQSLGFGVYDIEKESFENYYSLEDFKGLKNLPYSINSVLDVHIDDKNNEIWLLTRYKGLIQYNLLTHQYHIYTLHNWDSNIANFLYEDNRFWLGNSNNLYLYTLDHSKDERVFTKQAFSLKRGILADYGVDEVTCFFRDSRGRLWMTAMLGGLVEILEDRETQGISFKRLEAIGAEQLRSVPVQTVYEDTNGNLWLGTIGQGLWVYSYDRNEVLRYKLTSAIWGQSIYAIQEDEYKRIWVSTNRGLSCINMTRGEVINYTSDDGLQGNNFIKGAAFKDQDGSLYFGGYYGFNVFDPSDVGYNRYVPPLAFTELTIDNKETYVDYPGGEPLVLNHKQSSFSVSFAALSYVHSNNNHYSYILDGFDQEWTQSESGAEKIIYGRISPGRYSFKVKGSNNNGIWNDKPLELKIIIKKSPYKSILAYIIYIIMIMTIVMIAFMIWKRDFNLKQAYKEEQNERLRADKLNLFKLRFFTNISHELLTPLSVISNAIEQTSEKISYRKSDLRIIQRNTKRLINLIDQLLDFRKVETDAKKLKVALTEVDQLIALLEENFIILCDKKNIQFNVYGIIGKAVWIDIDKLDKILHNLLSNAFKYTPEGGSISLYCQLENRQEQEHLTVRISDTGPGIPEKDLPYIFDRFYRVEDHKMSGGTGIGLAFTKSLVALHKGMIGVSNNSEGGAAFFFDLPVTEEAFSEDEKEKVEELPEISSKEFFDDVLDASDSADIQKVFVSDRKISVLLVEDNTDMRSILRNYLDKHYQVFEAEHGKKALEVLSAVNVDIIISDVMMPEMDGIELCKRIKGDVKTSHIPVVLMTAKRTQDDIIEGYEALADSYIAKPVNIKLLQIRIDNLIQQREQLKKTLVKPGADLLSDVKISTVDKEFMDNINKVIKDNISNSEFTVRILHKSVSSSESVVFRKIKALTGLSPNQYIREIRLNFASQMLKKGIKSLEVCYQCGFTDPSYFSACFKKKFGVTPSKYVV